MKWICAVAVVVFLHGCAAWAPIKPSISGLKGDWESTGQFFYSYLSIEDESDAHLVMVSPEGRSALFVAHSFEFHEDNFTLVVEPDDGSGEKPELMKGKLYVDALSLSPKLGEDEVVLQFMRREGVDQYRTAASELIRARRSNKEKAVTVPSFPQN